MASSSKPQRSTEALGTVLNDRYQLVRLLGDGGVGAVYKAADLVLRRFVAIKMLHSKALERGNAIARFEREARASAAIGHPNIVDVLDFGHAKGKPFLVMEYLRGQPLSRLIARGGRLGVERACRVATHALTGLAAAHAHNIVHRDLKPANLMLVSHLGEHDFVKICDFGFAAILLSEDELKPEDQALTPARTLVGTPAYAAPERLRGKGSRFPSADIYSIGVVLYEMLSGRRPFEALGFAELSRQVLRTPPKSLAELRPDLPEGLVAAVHQALAKEPEARWASAEAFASELVPFGGRFIPLENPPSDTFTIDLQAIQARQTNRQRALDAEEAAAVLAQSVDSVDAPTDVLPARPSAEILTPTPDVHSETPTTAGDASLPPLHSPSSLSVDGVLVIPTLRFVANRFGERALSSTLESLSAESRRAFVNGVSEGEFVSLHHLLELIGGIDRHLGNDDLHLVVHCGRAMGEGLVSARQDERNPPPPIPRQVTSLPALSRKCWNGVRLSASRVGDGYARLELREESEPALLLHVAMLGLIETFLERAGGQDVEVTMLSSKALGDGRTVFEFTWL